MSTEFRKGQDSPQTREEAEQVLLFPGNVRGSKGEGDFDAVLTFDACNVNLHQLNFASMIETVLSRPFVPSMLPVT